MYSHSPSPLRVTSASRLRSVPWRWRIALIPIALSALVVALAGCGATTTPGGNTTPTPKPSPTATPPCTTWSVVPSPNSSQLSQSNLLAVSALSPANAWAVGSSSSNGGPTHDLIQQWGGVSWQVVPGTSENLVDVAAVSANDVWAVGSEKKGLPEPYQSRALIEHWNGVAWNVVSSPRLGSQDQLNGVVALSSSDIWAVGSTLGTGARLPLIEHWNGTAWSIVSGPALSGVTDSALRAVTRIPGTNELWAVGYVIKGQRPSTEQALIEHWNGTAWTLVTPTKPATMATSGLNDVVALSSSDAWAVGTYVSSGSEKSQGLIERWNGTSWQPVAIPGSALPSGITPSEFYGVAASSAQDVRAVGRYFLNEEGTGRALIARWDGSGWSVTASPMPNGVTHGNLNAITTDGAGHFWAVGWYFVSATGNQQTLILHCP